MSVEALRAAAADSGASTDLLAAADAVYAVATASWMYRDQAALVAEAVGARPAETVVSARFGGDGAQLMINAAAEAIASGAAEIVLVTGAEAGASLAAAQKSGATPDWPQQADDVAPTRVLGSDREANNDAEAAAQLGVPIYMYALLESAVRAEAGRDPASHQARIGELWSRFSEVAADNPYAWLPTAFGADELSTSSEDNRPISSPYLKLHCANLTVDLASGLILCSAAAAQAAGVPQDRWVFVHAGAAGHDEWFVSERADLAASPAIRTIGAAALAHAGIGIDDVAHVDLYSCFPAAVQIAAAELGLPDGRPEAAAHRHRRADLRRRAGQQLRRARGRHAGRPAARRSGRVRAVHVTGLVRHQARAGHLFGPAAGPAVREPAPGDRAPAGPARAVRLRRPGGHRGGHHALRPRRHRRVRRGQRRDHPGRRPGAAARAPIRGDGADDGRERPRRSGRTAS